MKTQQGFGLVQVLVTVAIMGIVLTAVATMMVTQMQETKAMTEKLAVLDVQRNLNSLISKPGACTYNLERAALAPYDFSAGDGTASRPFPPISLGASLASGRPATGAAETLAYRVTIDPNSTDRTTIFPASVVTPSLYIREIRLRIRCDSPPCNYSTASEVPAYYEVAFHDRNLVRSLAPVRVSVSLNVTGAGAFKTISGCYGDNVAPPGLRQDTCLPVNVNNCEYNSCMCPVGYYATGLQVGIRRYQGGQGVNTWAQIFCCLP